MPFETIAYLAFVLSAVALFAAALTYAEWATRHANDPVRKPDQLRDEKSAYRQDNDKVQKAA